MDINKVTLIGRLTRPPEAKKLTSGQPMATFTVATSSAWKDSKTKEKKEKTEFHRVVAWGRLADIAAAYLGKGSRVYVEGRLQYGEWTDKEGKKRTSVDVITDELILLSPASGTADRSGVTEEKELVVEEV